MCDLHTSVHHDPSQMADTEKMYADTDRYATCYSRLHTVKPDYSVACLDQVRIRLGVCIVVKNPLGLTLDTKINLRQRITKSHFV
ncbi:hypothetical protein TNCV_3805691 [Trichonephila clavipes]|nr:hypothetical protein TNCV_3805691 [Trichonephila clavipes]